VQALNERARLQCEGQSQEAGGCPETLLSWTRGVVPGSTRLIHGAPTFPEAYVRRVLRPAVAIYASPDLAGERHEGDCPAGDRPGPQRGNQDETRAPSSRNARPWLHQECSRNRSIVTAEAGGAADRLNGAGRPAQTGERALEQRTRYWPEKCEAVFG